jgi:hypothetical protein
MERATCPSIEMVITHLEVVRAMMRDQGLPFGEASNLIEQCRGWAGVTSDHTRGQGRMYGHDKCRKAVG